GRVQPRQGGEGKGGLRRQGKEDEGEDRTGACHAAPLGTAELGRGSNCVPAIWARSKCRDASDQLTWQFASYWPQALLLPWLHCACHEVQPGLFQGLTSKPFLSCFQTQLPSRIS